MGASKVRLESTEAQCAKVMTELRSAFEQVVNDTRGTIANASCRYVQTQGVTADTLSRQFSCGDQEILVENMHAFLLGIPGMNLIASEFDVGLHCCGSCVTKLNLIGMSQEFRKCSKEIAITTCFHASSSSTSRNLDIGEIVQILERPRTDDTLGITRARCLALSDHKEGWVTLRNAYGTNFLEQRAKPYYCCKEEMELQSAFERSSPQVHTVHAGGVFEVIEGPRTEPSLKMMRIRGIAQQDGLTGWVTLRDSEGNTCLDQMKILTCRTGISITSAFDISISKSIRKLGVGEDLKLLEGPAEDTGRKLTRCRVRSMKDGQEGWITIKGNQGNIYAEESDRHYFCRRSLPLSVGFESSSNSLRTLNAHEIFEALDAPQEEVMEGVNRVKARSLLDGSEGWLTFPVVSLLEEQTQHNSA